MKGRHCPRLPGPKRQPRQGVNADAAAYQVVFITAFQGSQPRVSPSVNTAENMLIRSTNWQQICLPGPLTDKQKKGKILAFCVYICVCVCVCACSLHTVNNISYSERRDSTAEKDASLMCYFYCVSQ